MYLEWSKDYELNISKIDTHHKRLIEIINRLSEANTNNKSSDIIENIFGSLISYGNYHFSIEEVVMRNSLFHRYELHKKEHEIFINEIRDLFLKYKKGDKQSLKTTIDYLNNWIIGHIMVEDREYATVLSDKF